MDDVVRNAPPIGAPSNDPIAWLMGGTGKVVRIGSAEWLLDRPNVSNGGTVVLLRTVWSTAVILLILLGVQNISDPHRTWQPSWHEFIAQLDPKVVGTVLAALYAALYARFASQWTYVAGVYNQIKATELKSGQTDREILILSQWKAGFIEDVSDLHLLCKRMFVSTVIGWGEDPGVRESFDKSCCGGAARFDRILRRARLAQQMWESKSTK